MILRAIGDETAGEDIKGDGADAPMEEETAELPREEVTSEEIGRLIAESFKRQLEVITND